MPILPQISIAAAAYALAVPLLKFRVGDAVLKPIMTIYNILMSTFSAYSVYTTFNVLKRLSMFNADCNLYFNDPTFRDITYLFTLSKIVEFADTLFLIARGKRVSWLHYLHHIGACVNMAIMYDAKFEAVFGFVFLNGFIHTVMYCYYGFASLGIRLPGKKYLTTAQIIQFLVCFCVLWQYRYIEPCHAGYRLFCFWYTYSYVGILIVMFGNFYFKTYNPKKTRD